MIVITFAVPEESIRFRRLLTGARRVRIGALQVLEGRVGMEAVLVAHIGMGLEAAGRNTSILLEARRPQGVIAAGFGGALSPDLCVGDLVIDSRSWPMAEFSEDKVPGARVRLGAIVSRSSPMETPEEKRRLAIETGALVVDMETDAIAAACAGSGVPLLGVRAVSDGASDPLPIPLPAWFDLKAQRPRPAVLVGYLLTHPGAIMPFVRFLKGLPAAQTTLAQFLTTFLGNRQHSIPIV